MDLTNDQNRWEAIMADASLASVTFPLARRAVSGGIDFGRIRVIGRRGQGMDPTGGQPLSFQLEIPLFNGVEGRQDLYPTVYQDLIGVCTDDATQGPVDYTDPILGAFRVAVTKFEVNEQSEPRDGAVVKIDLEEVTDADASFVTPQRSAFRQVSQSAAAIDGQLASLGVSDQQVTFAISQSGYPRSGDDVWVASAIVSSIASLFLASLQQGALGADELSLMVNAFRWRMRALVLGIDECNTVDGWPIYANAMILIDVAGQLAERAIASAAPIRLVEVAAPISAYELAVKLYGDVSRVDDVFRRAPTPRPWSYPRGTVIRLPSR